jgi:hypothetical protein
MLTDKVVCFDKINIFYHHYENFHGRSFRNILLGKTLEIFLEDSFENKLSNFIFVK